MAKTKINLLIAKNPSTPIDVLKALAQKKDEVVRSDVASNPSTPQGGLKALGKDRSDDEIYSGGINPKCNVDLINILLGEQIWIEVLG